MLAEHIGEEGSARSGAPDARPPAPCRLLIADDQPDVLEALRLLLKPQGFHAGDGADPALVLEALSARQLGRRAD